MRPHRPVHPVRPVRTLLVVVLLVAAPVLSAFADDGTAAGHCPSGDPGRGGRRRDDGVLLHADLDAPVHRPGPGAPPHPRPAGAADRQRPAGGEHRGDDLLPRLARPARRPGGRLPQGCRGPGGLRAHHAGRPPGGRAAGGRPQPHPQGRLLGASPPVRRGRSAGRCHAEDVGLAASRVGGADHVDGRPASSRSRATSPDARAHASMWQWVDLEVYAAFADVWATQVEMRDRPPRSRAFAGDGWQAYFSPLTRPVPAADPVMRRLAGIPARPGTVIRIAMYSMWDDRGGWIAHAGWRRWPAAAPGSSSSPARPSLRRSARSCVPAVSKWSPAASGTGPTRTPRTCRPRGSSRAGGSSGPGSVRTTGHSRGMSSDEAVLGVRSRSMHALFGAQVDRLQRRTGGVFDAGCQPRG